MTKPMTENIMTPDELLRQNDVVAALNTLKACVRGKPEDTKLRVFLFQMFSVLGQYDKAFNQLNVLAQLDPLTIPMVQTYKTLLPSEAFRVEVFGGQHMPAVFMPDQHQPEINDRSTSYMQPLLLSLQKLGLEKEGGGSLDAAVALSQQAIAAAPALSGTINGDAFTWLMDGDSRMGPALEVVIKGKYYWLPFERIRSIKCEAPEDLRDMIWFPAHFTWHNGDQAIGFIPVRYPETLSQEDPRFWLSKKTDWQSMADTYFVGMGQRTLLTDSNEYPLLELRSLEFDTPEAPNELEETAGENTDGSATASR